MTPRASLKTGSAASILAYYLRKTWERAGLGWTADNEAEIEEAMQEIVEAAVSEAETRADSRDHEGGR